MFSVEPCVNACTREHSQSVPQRETVPQRERARARERERQTRERNVHTSVNTIASPAAAGTGCRGGFCSGTEPQAAGRLKPALCEDGLKRTQPQPSARAEVSAATNDQRETSSTLPLTCMQNTRWQHRCRAAERLLSSALRSSDRFRSDKKSSGSRVCQRRAGASGRHPTCRYLARTVDMQICIWNA